jgi:hypothetical protein
MMHEFGKIVPKGETMKVQENQIKRALELNAQAQKSFDRANGARKTYAEAEYALIKNWRSATEEDTAEVDRLLAQSDVAEAEHRAISKELGDCLREIAVVNKVGWVLNEQGDLAFFTSVEPGDSKNKISLILDTQSGIFKQQLALGAVF